MSQNTLILPTTGTVSGLTMAADINNALDTLNTMNSGGAAPAAPQNNMLWTDTANNQVKQRDETNSFWLPLWSVAKGIAVQPGASRDGAITGLSGAAGTSCTFTASQIIVASALAPGLCVGLANYNQTLNVAGVGAGGMDTGVMPNGYICIYAIYNIATDTRSILACAYAVTNGAAIYTGANMPAGYTLSALISVWRGNASNQMVLGTQQDRTVAVSLSQVLSTTTMSPTATTSLSISGVVPPNARFAAGFMTTSNTALTAITATIVNTTSASVNGIDQNYMLGNSVSSLGGNWALAINVSQTIHYSISNNATGTCTFNVFVSDYTF